MSERASIEGTTRWLRSRSLGPRAGHVFAHIVDLDPWEHSVTGYPGRGIADWIHDVIHHMPEGARVRFIVEVVHPDGGSTGKADRSTGEVCDGSSGGSTTQPTGSALSGT